MSEIRKYVLVDANGEAEAFEFDTYKGAVDAAQVRTDPIAVEERTYTLDDTDLVWTSTGDSTWPPSTESDDEMNDEERKAVDLIDGDERLANFAAGCGSGDLEERLTDEIDRNDLDIDVNSIDFVKVMNRFQDI